MKVLCLICGEWFEWTMPPVERGFQIGRCENMDCKLQAAVQSVMQEKCDIALAALEVRM